METPLGFKILFCSLRNVFVFSIGWCYNICLNEIWFIKLKQTTVYFMYPHFSSFLFFLFLLLQYFLFFLFPQYFSFFLFLLFEEPPFRVGLLKKIIFVPFHFRMFLFPFNSCRTVSLDIELATFFILAWFHMRNPLLFEFHYR